MLYPLFNKIQRNFDETVCGRSRFAIIKTTRLVLTVEGILFFEQLYLNLAEKKFPIKGTSNEFSMLLMFRF